MTMTAEEQYAANLELLRQRLPDMAHGVAQYPMTNIQLLPNPQGQIIGQVWDVPTQAWVPLGNPTDPAGEADTDAASLCIPSAKVFCLLGVGLGYTAVAIAKRLRPYQRLVLWELDPSVFKAALYAVDLAPLFQKRVDIFVGWDALTHVERWWLSLEAHEKMHLAFPMRAGYTTICQKVAYDALGEKTMDMLRFHAVGLSTWKTFGALIGDNDLLNAPEYFVTPGYEKLEGLWQDKPAVCIAAGPSLQKNLRLLLNPEVRERVAVITVGTCYALLRGLGIEPDIVTTIDFQRLNWTDQFQYVPLDAACPLVYLHSTYPQTVRRWPGPKFVAENSSDTLTWLRQFGDGKKSAGQVQTVAHLNVLVALELGANPILLMGQDLAMPRDAHHTAGARAQDQAPDEVDPEAFIEALDYAGQPCWTRHSFLSMKTVFERIIAENPGRVINCSEGGLALAGAPNMPLKHAIEATPFHGEGGMLRQRIAAVWRDYKPVIREDVLSELTKLRAQVEELATWSVHIQAFVREHGLATPSLRQHVLAGEQVLGKCQAAWSLFAIRHFGLIELLAQIPPENYESLTPEDHERLTCERLVVVAGMLQEVLPRVRYLLRVTERRLTDALSPSQGARGVVRRMARQNYHQAAQCLTHPGVIDGEAYRMLLGHLYRHRQEYETACAVLGDGNGTALHVTRMRRHLARWHTLTAAAIPAYFREGA